MKLDPTKPVTQYTREEKKQFIKEMYEKTGFKLEFTNDPTMIKIRD